MTDEEEMAFNLRAKAEMRRSLRSLSWEQKVASIERMNAAGKTARKVMRRARERGTAEAVDTVRVS